MMNKKLVALLVTILTVSASMLAYHRDCWIDEDGIKHCEERGHLFSRDRRECIGDECYEGPVRRTGHYVGGTVERTGEAVGEAVKAPFRIFD